MCFFFCEKDSFVHCSDHFENPFKIFKHHKSHNNDVIFFSPRNIQNLFANPCCCYLGLELCLSVCLSVFQGWVMAVRWSFYTPVSTTLWYWPGPSSISSSLLTLNFPGRVAETAGTQVGWQWRSKTRMKGSSCSGFGCKQPDPQTRHECKWGM